MPLQHLRNQHSPTHHDIKRVKVQAFHLSIELWKACLIRAKETVPPGCFSMLSPKFLSMVQESLAAFPTATAFGVVHVVLDLPACRM